MFLFFVSKKKIYFNENVFPIGNKKLLEVYTLKKRSLLIIVEKGGGSKIESIFSYCGKRKEEKWQGIWLYYLFPTSWGMTLKNERLLSLWNTLCTEKISFYRFMYAFFIREQYGKEDWKKKKKKLDIFCCISACKDSKAKQTV